MGWLSVIGYEGAYEVNNIGEVRRIGKGRGVKTGGRVLKQTNHKQGYKAISLHLHNRCRTFLVHRLVGLTFLGPIPKGHEVNHKDGNKRNNRVENLEYVTRPYNMAHAVIIGTLNNSGANNPSAKLTAEQVKEIRRQYQFGGGPGYKALAGEYGVTWEAIRNIIKRRVWGWL